MGSETPYIENNELQPVNKDQQPYALTSERPQIDDEGFITGYTNTFAFYWDSGEYKGVEVWFDHVGGTNGGAHGGQLLNKQSISNNKLIGPQNQLGSRQIGYIGGLGGRQDPRYYNPPFNRHTHSTVKKNGKKIDPRKVFCGW